MKNLSLFCFIVQFCPICNCHVRQTKLANRRVFSSWSWNWGFLWDNGEEILGALHAITDAPAGLLGLPCSMVCHHAALLPAPVQKQSPLWCSWSGGQTKDCIWVHAAQSVSDLSVQVTFHRGKPDLMYFWSLPVPHKNVNFLPDAKSWNNSNIVSLVFICLLKIRKHVRSI